MFVCICSAVSERQVEHAINNGVNTLESLAVVIGAGACCGSCRPLLLDIIEQQGCAVALAA